MSNEFTYYRFRKPFKDSFAEYQVRNRIYRLSIVGGKQFLEFHDIICKAWLPSINVVSGDNLKRKFKQISKAEAMMKMIP